MSHDIDATRLSLLLNDLRLPAVARRAADARIGSTEAPARCSVGGRAGEDGECHTILDGPAPKAAVIRSDPAQSSAR